MSCWLYSHIRTYVPAEANYRVDSCSVQEVSLVLQGSQFDSFVQRERMIALDNADPALVELVLLSWGVGGQGDIQCFLWDNGPKKKGRGSQDLSGHSHIPHRNASMVLVLTPCILKERADFRGVGSWP